MFSYNGVKGVFKSFVNVLLFNIIDTNRLFTVVIIARCNSTGIIPFVPSSLVPSHILQFFFLNAFSINFIQGEQRIISGCTCCLNSILEPLLKIV